MIHGLGEEFIDNAAIVDQEQYQAPTYYCPTPFPNNQDTDPVLLRMVHAACLTRV